MDTNSNHDNGKGRPPLYGKKLRQVAVMMPVEMIAWMNDQPDGASGVTRKLIQQAMELEETKREMEK